MKAAVVDAVGAPFEIREVTLDPPRWDEIQVRLVATGVCHTDAVVRTGGIPTRFPIVLGHEGAGIVTQVGGGVTHLAPGDHVVLGFNSCGVCDACVSAHPASCAQAFTANFAGRRSDGSTAYSDESGAPIASHFFGQSSFAEMVNAPARIAVKVPNDLPLELAGPLGCGIQTGAGAVLNVLRPPAGSSLVVFGTGAVGTSAVLAAASARVSTIIAVDINDSRLERARGFGATHAINGASEDVVERIREITGGGVRFALDTTGNATVFRQMLDALAPSGRAAALGATPPGSEGTIDLMSAQLKGIVVTWVIEGDSVPQTFVPYLIELHRRGQFPFDRLIKTYPFADIEAAFEASRTGEVLKPVVVF